MLIAAGAFGVLWTTDSFSEPSIRIDDPLVNTVIVVAIDGAIATPGLYELPGGSRVRHVLDAAGGVRLDADLAAVNPAERISDGQRIVIPSLSPPQAALASSASTLDHEIAPLAAVATLETPTVLPDQATTIDLNSATQAELESLPGIGPVKAAAIVAYRTEHGRFATVSDLDDVEGISISLITELSPLVHVGV